MALSFCGSSPTVCMRFSVSRQEMPASTRMLAVELESTVEFPLLPLARTVMRIATERSIAGIGDFGNAPDPRTSALTRGRTFTSSAHPPQFLFCRHIHDRSRLWADLADNRRRY